VNKILARIQDLGALAWVRFLQSLNAIAISLAGGALVVQQSYPDLVRQIVAKVPGYGGAVGLFLFGVVVHYALRRAAKAA
jgi:hypothetical protein